jgi:catalase-peroxidase
MFTTDLALRFDPAYGKITKRWLENPAEFEKAFARAWFKLTHRDMGPRARYLGAEVPAEVLPWQDPVPAVAHKLTGEREEAELKAKILQSGLSTAELIRAAWASASSFRNSDMRGGANGARVRLAPQNGWAVNDPEELKKVITALEKIATDYNSSNENGMKISVADIIVLGGAAAIEDAAKRAGVTVEVPFTAGRGDADQASTNVASFAPLEPKADAFRNYFVEGLHGKSPTAMLVDKAAQLNLTVPEMTVLLGGMRVLGANAGNVAHGQFTNKLGTLSNDFFVNLLDMNTVWTKSEKEEGVYIGTDRTSNAKKWSATPVDLIFGSNSELRALVEVYAFDESKEKFVNDFVAAWSKVMLLDRFDLKHAN